MKNSKILYIVQISLMSVIIILCSWTTIPFPVPITLQTFGLYFALLLLGGRKGTASLLLYIILGVAGLPVFSGFTGGVGHLLSPTGGYIWGFILCALLYLLTEKLTEKNIILKLTALFAGTLLCYTAGTLWFIFSIGNYNSLWQILSICVLPFAIPDLLKILFAVLICNKVRPLVNKTFKE